MAQQHSYHQFRTGGRNTNRGINPSDLSMAVSFASPPFSGHTFSSSNAGRQPHGFSTASALFGDDELLEGLGTPNDPQSTATSHPHDFSGMGDMSLAFSPTATYSSHRVNPSLRLDHITQINGFSQTPEGDPIPSPFVQGFPVNSFHQPLGPSLQSPISYSVGSPHTSSDSALDENDRFLQANGRRTTLGMQRKPTHPRSPLTPKSSAMHGLSIRSQDSTSFGSHPIRASTLHDKPQSTPWVHTPGSVSYGSAFSSPLQPGLGQINEVMMKGGTSMPAKLGIETASTSTQEMKRKRRRESHNLVERRRRDNINERIHDLSRLVPAHRLEDERVRKMIQNGTPLSPTLPGMSRPTSVVSGLAVPGVRRTTSNVAGSITTGLPVEDKDKGPNKGDILNGAVSWTRDLMWMLHLKLQQQEELMNCIADLGGHFPFELTEDEKRMQTELMGAMSKNSPDQFSYSRTPGSGLRVPHHTDYNGEPLSDGHPMDGFSVSPGDHDNVDLEIDMDDGGQFWHRHDEDGGGGGSNSITYKEEDEF